MSDAVLLTDDDGAVVLASANARGVLGLDADVQCGVARVDRVLGDAGVDGDVLRAAGEVRNIEVDVTDACGRMRRLLVDVKRVNLAGGTRLWVCRDVSERTPVQRAAVATDDGGSSGRDTACAEQASLRELVTHLDRTLERERRDIACELQDDLGQRLAAIRLAIALLRPSGTGREVADRHGPALAGIDRELGAAVRAVRAIAARLHPAVLDDLGLEAGIEALLADVRRSAPLDVVWTLDAGDVGIDPRRDIVVYRVLQECVGDVLRHDRSGRLRVTLRREGESLRLVIVYEGRGGALPLALRHAGPALLGMHERVRSVGGSLCIGSPEANAIEVRLTVPLVRREAGID